MSKEITRRQMLRLSAASATALALSGCGLWGPDQSASKEKTLDTQLYIMVGSKTYTFLGDNLEYPDVSGNQSKTCTRHSFDTTRSFLTAKSNLIVQLVDENPKGPLAKVIVGARKDASTVTAESNTKTIHPELIKPLEIPFFSPDPKITFDGMLTLFYQDKKGRIIAIDYMIATNAEGASNFTHDSIEIYNVYEAVENGDLIKKTSDGHLNVKLTEIDKQGYGFVAYVYQGFIKPISLPQPK